MKEKQYFKYKIDILQALSEHGVNFYTARRDKTFGQATLDKIRKGENITVNTACKICAILGVELSDIIEIVPDPEES